MALCPYPTTCEHDDYRRTGEHVCQLAHCPYRIHARRIVAGQIKQLAAAKNRTGKQDAQLEKLKAQYARLLESR